MPVSGLVVSLTRNDGMRAEAIASIRAEPRIEIGVIRGCRMSIVVDTETDDDDKQLWCWLSSIPGVVFVDVAMVAFDGAEQTTSTPCNPPASSEMLADEH